ncbi:hypothetical protein SARC_17356, partial [Sphaeroforma arctica JP610]
MCCKSTKQSTDLLVAPMHGATIYRIQCTPRVVVVLIISKLRLETSYKKKERDRREREKRAARRKKEKLKKEQEAIRQGKIPTAPPQPKELTAEERRQKK